jgi:hypothetical protein
MERGGGRKDKIIKVIILEKVEEWTDVGMAFDDISLYPVVIVYGRVPWSAGGKSIKGV